MSTQKPIHAEMPRTNIVTVRFSKVWLTTQQQRTYDRRRKLKLSIKTIILRHRALN